MKKSILISALLLCIAPSVFGQEDELKTATERKEKKNKKQQYINKEEAERIRKEEEQREKAKDISRIKDYIKKVFIKWAEKGEFESSKEHFERIQSERVKKLHQVITDGFTIIMNNTGTNIELGTYNADEKIYPITITLFKWNEDRSTGSADRQFIIKTNVPFEKEEAIDFQGSIKSPKNYNFQGRDPDNWFVADGFLFPINVEYRGILKNIFDKENYPLFSEYVFNTDDLGLSEYFPENYTFTLGDYIKSLKEKQENNQIFIKWHK